MTAPRGSSPGNTRTVVFPLLFVIAPLAFGGLALALGMDADWDLRNYHYYNAWAFLTDRYRSDIAVAQIPTFYNPFLDIPYFLLAQAMPARALAFLLGALHGLNVILLALLGERLIPIRDTGRRRLLAAAAAVAGACGAMALSEVGTVFYDNLLSLGFLATLLLTIRAWDRLAVSGRGAAVAAAFLTGLPVGLAFGLKLTTVTFCAGHCVALLLCLPAAPSRRFLVAFSAGIGVLAGLAAGGGYWMGHLWSLYGNPLFPMFNQVFQSPWGLPDAYRDTQFLDGGLFRRLVYPIIFSIDSREAGEVLFRDYRILLAFLLVPASGIAILARRRRAVTGTGTAPGTGYTLTAVAIAYGVWLQMFALYRYITAIEMLAPLLVVLSLGLLWPGTTKWRPTALALLAAMILTTRPGDWIRVPFTGRAVEVAVPAIADPDHTIVLLAGHEPLSFLLPSFPDGMRFLRIDSTFTNPDQRDVRFNQVMRRQVAGHQGPLMALFIPTERHDVVRRLGDYGLALANTPCAEVTSPIGAAPYALCPLERRFIQ
ncbi:MAG: hypothetical protein F8N37_21175 [Telmatospirillum sp.]|nr:hypothetical protein [Telmatospirillum sp.]